MTLIKSLLLGSAAGIVAVASAQAADLPTKKGAPAAEYVRICTITANGTPITGFVLPGSDTCFKISGYVSAQYTLGSLSGFDMVTAPSTLTHTGSAGISNYGMFDRGQVNFEAVSNTAYGPLYSIIELQGNFGNGFDSTAAGAVINHAYLTWAGLTAGKHGSFFDYLAGGYTWDDLISPDHSGGPIPLIAYTASFGGGFSATVSAEQNTQVVYGPNSYFQGSPLLVLAPGAAGATRDPDLVASLDLQQGWGNAHLAGVAHNVRETTAANGSLDKWGFAVIGGLTFNLPSFGAGDDIRLQGVYSKNAIGYSGLTSIGGYNASGIGFGLGDTLNVGPGLWATPTTWSVAIRTDFALGPTFSIHPEISYGHLSWSGLPALNAVVSPNLSEFVGGGAIEWVPVKNLVFDLDLLYLNGTQSAPSGWTGVGVNAWHSGFSGFNGKLRIERDF